MDEGRTKKRASKKFYVLIEYLKALQRYICFFALLFLFSMCSDHAIFLVNIKQI